MIQETPIVGKIYKVKLNSGRTWIFKSAYQGKHLTAFEAAYCINDGGDSHFTNYISNRIGYHAGANNEIISLVPANENEISMFERKLEIL